MAEKLPQIPDKLAWQIDRRCRIQNLLLNLRKFLEKHQEFPEPETGEFWMQMCWMVDAAFSLWRAAFLTDIQKDNKKIYGDMKDFLTKVIEHNAITFADDHRMRSWSGAYYNANARYRIERIVKWNAALSTDFVTVQEFNSLRKKGYLGLQDPCNIWDVCFLALTDIYAWFESQWHRHMRPGTTRRNNPRRRSRSQ